MRAPPANRSKLPPRHRCKAFAWASGFQARLKENRFSPKTASLARNDKINKKNNWDDWATWRFAKKNNWAQGQAAASDETFIPSGRELWWWSPATVWSPSRSSPARPCSLPQVRIDPKRKALVGPDCLVYFAIKGPKWISSLPEASPRPNLLNALVLSGLRPAGLSNHKASCTQHSALRSKWPRMQLGFTSAKGGWAGAFKGSADETTCCLSCAQ